MKKFSTEPAPIAGFTDLAFRRVLKKCGAKRTWTEMISAAALFYKNRRTQDMLRTDKNTVVQLFGKVPAHFEYVCASGLLDAFDEININMGCPAPKIVRNGEGAALMKKPDLAREIIMACVRTANKPVSVKFRLGHDKNTAVEFAKMCENAGASRIIIHGRLAVQGYSGTADYNAIAEVVKAVGIPVIANGDICGGTSAEKCIEQTGADGVMIGRAVLGKPWLIKAKGIEATEKQIKKIIAYHLMQAEKLNGNGGILEMRKHLLYYASNFKDAKALKLRLAVCRSYDEAREILGI